MLTARSLTAGDRLTDHLTQWLGSWPPTSDLQVVGAAQRAAAGGDGRVHPGPGVGSPHLGAVLSVPAEAAPRVRHAAQRHGTAATLAALPDLLALPGRGTSTAVFRWTTSPAPLPEVGQWVDADAAGLPEWLRPFGGQVLVTTAADGTHSAGVGVKRHDAARHEPSVVTAPAARGQGLARSLVAQAARRVLDEGAVPTYLHEGSNTASARTADAAGFPDRG